MHLDIPELTEIKLMLKELCSTLVTHQEWYNLEQAYRIKYGRLEKTMNGSAVVYSFDGPSYNSIKQTLALQPAGGIPDGWGNQRKLWKHETVMEWIKVDDTGLEEYLKKVAPLVKVPDWIKQGLKKKGISRGLSEVV